MRCRLVARNALGAAMLLGSCEFHDPPLRAALEGKEHECPMQPSAATTSPSEQRFVIDDFESGPSTTQTDCTPVEQAACDGVTTNNLDYRTRTYCDRDRDTHVGTVCAEFVAGERAWDAGRSLKLSYDVASSPAGVYSGYVERLSEEESSANFRGPFNLEALGFRYLSLMVRADISGVDMEVGLKDLALRQTNAAGEGKVLVANYVERTADEEESADGTAGVPTSWRKARIPIHDLMLLQEAGADICVDARRMQEINFGFARDRFAAESRKSDRAIPLTGAIYLDEIAFEQ